jgi:hypothetical protein
MNNMKDPMLRVSKLVGVNAGYINSRALMKPLLHMGNDPNEKKQVSWMIHQQEFCLFNL